MSGRKCTNVATNGIADPRVRISSYLLIDRAVRRKKLPTSLESTLSNVLNVCVNMQFNSYIQINKTIGTDNEKRMPTWKKTILL